MGETALIIDEHDRQEARAQREADVRAAAAEERLAELEAQLRWMQSTPTGTG